MPDMILSINYENEGKQGIILFSCKYKDRKEVEAFFKDIYKDKFQIVRQETIKNENVSENSFADKIKKLADLKEKGLITEEEFVQMKQKLISS
ncbi:SHOCT domain-containing protein [Thermoflexibacter ruber]|uniref:Short C-terminal domain-containing protein n=1 Tax=Thermoflexibacter ruber TaxID=1003 RepID=A0A1I2E094_9BACT|nr:SHOCT domain-containing protein [Thermoflexibacter ruber]SFE85670.1 Short C-terminal domain-containing protein [Thermoflexibacter ruber]